MTRTASSDNSVPSDDWLEVIFRNKWKVLFIPLLSIALGVFVILFFPRRYASQGAIFLQIGRESVGLDPTATTGQTISLQQTGREDEVRSSIEVLKSRGVIAKVVEQVTPEAILNPQSDSGASKAGATIPGLDNLKAAFGKLVGTLRTIDPISDSERAILDVEENLDIRAERGSTVIRLWIETDSPQLSQKILQAFVDVYQREHARLHRNQDSQKFFSDQRDSLARQLDEAKVQLAEAKNKLGIVSVEQRRETLEGQLREVELANYAAEQDLSTATARVAQLTGEVNRLPERLITAKTSKPNEGGDKLREQLYALQVKQMDAKARYSDAHPLVQTINEQVSEAERVVADQTKTRDEVVDDVNPVHRQLSLDLKQQQGVVAGLESRLETLGEQRDLVLQDLKRLNGQEIEIDRLEREVQLAETNFYQYAENLEQARIDTARENLRISNVSVSQPPQLMEKPTSPDKLLVALASLFLATAGAAGAVVGSERLGARVRSAAALERAAGIPTLQVVPESSRYGRLILG